MGRNKQIDKPLTIEMQYNIDVNNLINKRNKNDITHIINKNKIDHFNNTKPRDKKIITKINDLTFSYLQLYEISNNKGNAVIDMYNHIKNKEFIPLQTYITVINYFNKSDTNKENIKENIEIYGKCPQCDVQFITINDCTYCPICYLETTNIFSKDTNSTNGIEKFKSTYLYKRVSHYISKLDKLVACENTKIPDEIIKMIYDETEKERRSITNINIARIKYYLNKHHLTKYNENVNQIYKIITGKQLVYIPHIIKNLLIENFTKVDQVLSQLTEEDGNFNNFLNYNYLHYKICEHLNLKDYKNLFPLCKSQDKIYAHDNIWKIICKKLDWEFIPTI